MNRIEKEILFQIAKDLLKDFSDGFFTISENEYEFFRFIIPNKIKILFYPHKNSNETISMRVRNQSSKDKDLLEVILYILDKSQNNTNFHCKNKFHYLDKKKLKKILEDRNYSSKIIDELNDIDLRYKKYDYFYRTKTNNDE